ncbi:uncharacterized protein LOC135820113 [Sycon ciliatum]|uniref:uncharacterized protein LOC135820113 n=1 Tax=Sycon ciliatum TaxID=27933 RepID=UPI0031F62409
MAEPGMKQNARPLELPGNRDGSEIDGSSPTSASTTSSDGGSPLATHFFGVRLFGLRRTTLRRNRTIDVLESIGASQQLQDGQEEYRPTFGLGLSGGGFRSASFCAGVLKGILDSKQELDYLSSVSGGGYIASSYLDWKYREGGKDEPKWHKAYFGRMVDRITNGLARFERDTFLGVRDVVVGLSKLIFVHVFVSLLLLQVANNVTLEYIRIARGFSIGRQLAAREKSDAGSFLLPSLVSLILHLILQDALLHLFHSKHISKAKHLIGSLFKIYCLREVICDMVFILHDVLALGTLAEDTCHLMANGLQSVSYCGVLPGVLCFSAFGSFRLFLSLIVPNRYRQRLDFVLLLAFVTATGLEQTITSSDDTPSSALRDSFWIIATLAFPLLTVFHNNYLFNVVKILATSAFYHQSGSTSSTFLQKFLDFAQSYEFQSKRSRHRKPGKDQKPKHGNLRNKDEEELTLGDIESIKPEWISQITINNWRYDADDPRDVDCKMLTTSSKLVDIIDMTPDDDKSKFMDLKPANLFLSTALQMSAAAVAVETGTRSTVIQQFREIFVIFGLRDDVYLPSWFNSPQRDVDIVVKIAELLL